MKKIVIFSLALLHSHSLLSMLAKQFYRFPQHAKMIHSKNINLIRDIFKNTPIKDHEDYDDDRDYPPEYYYPEAWDLIKDYEERLKDLYFRNESIINILNKDIKDIKKRRTEEIKKMRKRIKTLHVQQNLAILGVSGNIDRIHEIEKELHTIFKVQKDKE